MENCIEMQNVVMRYDASFSLNHLSFDVKENEIFGFLGPSGAGKTTTIKLMTRQLKKSEGSIKLFGENIEQLAPSINDRIGILSDNSGCYERMTIEENLNFFAKIRGVNKQAVDDILKKVDLESARKKSIKKISKGMKQRVVLACALLHRPELLFLDEPTSGLDPATSRMIHDLLLELKEQGTTIFLTTHNMEEADKLCDRVAFLNKGTLIECGSPLDIKLKYARNQMEILTKDRQRILVEKNEEGAQQLLEVVSQNNLLTVHTCEPNLEDVFLQLTGSELK